ncbi:unnamed protein product [Choristocarpus tenellus]
MVVMNSLQSVLQVSRPEGHVQAQPDTLMASIAVKAETLIGSSRAEVPMKPVGQDAVRVAHSMLGDIHLTNSQREVVERVNNAMSADFQLRRRMLLRRCDVAVQSFLKGKDLLGSDKGAIAAQMKERMDTIADSSRAISVDDALQARHCVAWEHTRMIAAEAVAGKSVAKRVLMGDVPDRGGRVGESRGESKAPRWKARTELGDQGSGCRQGGKGGGRGRRGQEPVGNQGIGGHGSGVGGEGDGTVLCGRQADTHGKSVQRGRYRS